MTPHSLVTDKYASILAFPKGTHSLAKHLEGLAVVSQVKLNMEVSEKLWYPQIIHFNELFMLNC